MALLRIGLGGDFLLADFFFNLLPQMGHSDIFSKILLQAGQKYTLSNILEIPLVIIGMTLRFKCFATFDTV
jgi:hypothetical protein